MRNQASLLIKKSTSVRTWAWNLIFYGTLFLLIALAKLPPIPSQAFILKKIFMIGQENVFQLLDPGASFAVFESYTAHFQTITFLTDRPYNPYDMMVERLQASQRFFAPRILTPFPTEKIAILDCSTDAIAKTRAKETGYQITHSLGSGKAVAEKQS